MSQHTDENKPTAPDKPLLRQLTKIFPKQLWSAISHNLQWKLLALFLALLLWVGLILQDPSLTRERVFTGVPLSITGSDTLRRNGFIVTQGLEDENAIVRLKVDVPQQEYNDVAYSNFNPRIDLSKITKAGEQTVTASATSTSLYGTVTDISPQELPITVDNYITNYRIPVQVEVIGEYPDGYYGAAPTTDVSTVSVSGPESIVVKIAKIVLKYDVSGLAARSATMQTALALHYMDIDGNELDGSLLEPTSGGVLLRSIVLEQKLYPVKTFTLNQTALTTGTPMDGYEVKSVTLSPDAIVAAGDETTLNTMDTLFLEKAVDVEGRSESFTAEIRIEQPDNIVYMNTRAVRLVVDIGPVPETKTYQGIQLSVTGLPDGLSAELAVAEVNITLTGPALLMNEMSASRLKAAVSAEDVTEGTYDIPVTLTIQHDSADQFTYSLSPQSVTVTVTAQ